MVKKYSVIILSVFFTFLVNTITLAQCAMCRAGLESSVEEDVVGVGSTINQGILYLMSIPYILIGIGIYLYFNAKKKAKQASQNLA